MKEKFKMLEEYYDNLNNGKITSSMMNSALCFFE